MDLSNFATVVRFICKQLNSSELRVKWMSQSQNKRLQSTVPLGPIETIAGKRFSSPDTTLQSTVPLGPIETSSMPRVKVVSTQVGLQSTVPLGPIETKGGIIGF